MYSCGRYFSSKTNPVYVKDKELKVVQACKVRKDETNACLLKLTSLEKYKAGNNFKVINFAAPYTNYTVFTALLINEKKFDLLVLMQNCVAYFLY